MTGGGVGEGEVVGGSNVATGTCWQERNVVRGWYVHRAGAGNVGHQISARASAHIAAEVDGGDSGGEVHLPVLGRWSIQEPMLVKSPTAYATT